MMQKDICFFREEIGLPDQNKASTGLSSDERNPYLINLNLVFSDISGIQKYQEKTPTQLISFAD